MDSKGKTMLDEFVFQWGKKTMVLVIPNGLYLQYSLMLGGKLWKGKKELRKNYWVTALDCGTA